MSELETACRQDAPNPPALDRRAHKRYPSDLSAFCRLLRSPQDGPTWHVRVLDISAGGVGLDSGHAWKPGTELEIQLVPFGLWPRGALALAGLPVCLVSATVVRVVEKLQGLFVAGCAFDRQLTDEELRRLL